MYPTPDFKIDLLPIFDPLPLADVTEYDPKEAEPG